MHGNMNVKIIRLWESLMGVNVPAHCYIYFLPVKISQSFA